MANRTIPLRNAQTASRKIARRKNAKANGAGKAQRGKPAISGARFIARDQILPFDRTVFGLVDPYDRGVRIFRVEKYVNRNDRILLAWKRSKSWLTGRYIHMEVKEDGSRRVALQTLAWDETVTRPKNHGHMEFEWYELGPKDLLAVEMGTYYASEGANCFERQVWPDTYEALEAPGPDEWERRQRSARLKSHDAILLEMSSTQGDRLPRRARGGLAPSRAQPLAGRQSVRVMLRR
jgi:hypothetical protein